MKATKQDYADLDMNPALAEIFQELADMYADMWADCQEKPTREYLWFRQAAIAEIKKEIAMRFKPVEKVNS